MNGVVTIGTDGSMIRFRKQHCPFPNHMAKRSCLKLGKRNDTFFRREVSVCHTHDILTSPEGQKTVKHASMLGEKEQKDGERVMVAILLYSFVITARGDRSHI